jgi:hypothetical protein
MLDSLQHSRPQPVAFGLGLVALTLEAHCVEQRLPQPIAFVS